MRKRILCPWTLPDGTFRYEELLERIPPAGRHSLRPVVLLMVVAFGDVLVSFREHPALQAVADGLDSDGLLERVPASADLAFGSHEHWWLRATAAGRNRWQAQRSVLLAYRDEGSLGPFMVDERLEDARVDCKLAGLLNWASVEHAGATLNRLVLTAAAHSLLAAAKERDHA